MFSAGERRTSYRPYAGLAAASSVVRVLSVVVMPALAIDTVCCSITCEGRARVLSPRLCYDGSESLRSI